MAFAHAVTDRVVVGGRMTEYGTWTMTAGTTTGDITPAITGNGYGAGIFRIEEEDVESNGASAAMVPTLNALRSTLTITSVANDTGTYTIKGPIA